MVLERSSGFTVKGGESGKIDLRNPEQRRADHGSSGTTVKRAPCAGMGRGMGIIETSPLPYHKRHIRSSQGIDHDEQKKQNRGKKKPHRAGGGKGLLKCGMGHTTFLTLWRWGGQTGAEKGGGGEGARLSRRAYRMEKRRTRGGSQKRKSRGQLKNLGNRVRIMKGGKRQGKDLGFGLHSRLPSMDIPLYKAYGARQKIQKNQVCRPRGHGADCGKGSNGQKKERIRLWVTGDLWGSSSGEKTVGKSKDRGGKAESELLPGCRRSVTRRRGQKRDEFGSQLEHKFTQGGDEKAARSWRSKGRGGGKGPGKSSCPTVKMGEQFSPPGGGRWGKKSHDGREAG